MIFKIFFGDWVCWVFFCFLLDCFLGLLMLLLFNQFLLLRLFLRTCCPLFLVGSIFCSIVVVIVHPPLGFHPIFSNHNRPFLTDFSGVLYIMFTLWVLPHNFILFGIAGLATKGLFSLIRNC